MTSDQEARDKEQGLELKGLFWLAMGLLEDTDPFLIHLFPGPHYFPPAIAHHKRCCNVTSALQKTEKREVYFVKRFKTNEILLSPGCYVMVNGGKRLPNSLSTME